MFYSLFSAIRSVNEKSSTSNNPLSLNRNDGITKRAKNDRVINGDSIVDPKSVAIYNLSVQS